MHSCEGLSLSNPLLTSKRYDASAIICLASYSARAESTQMNLPSDATLAGGKMLS